MDFTFGIVTNGQLLDHTIRSIQQLNIPNYEIIIVGSTPTNILSEHIRYIPFDESVKEAWITRKKNLICEEAKYENVVLLHDYVIIHPDFYQGFLKFGSNYDVCVPKILNVDGSRYRDYILFPQYHWWSKVTGWKCNKFLLPYWLPTNTKLNKFVYISGSMYVVKKSIALKYPLDERLSWGKDEDVRFSITLSNNNVLMKCNPHSTVQFMKYKVRAYCMDNDVLSVHDVKQLFTELDRIEKEDPEFFAIQYDPETKQKINNSI